MADCVSCGDQVLMHHYFLIQGDGQWAGKPDRAKHYLCTNHPLDEIKKQAARMLTWATAREFGRVKMLTSPGAREVRTWGDDRRFAIWKAEEDGEIEQGSGRTGLIVVHLLPGEARNEDLVERFVTHSNWAVDNAIA